MTRNELEKAKEALRRFRGASDDLEELLEKLKPVVGLFWRLLPEEVKTLLRKYGITEE